jgi:hypothetical protein
MQDTSIREKLGRGERKREKVENREILSCLERKCPVENVLTLYRWRESLKKRENLCETFSLFISNFPPFSPSEASS